MYRKKNAAQLEFPDFYLPFSGKLDAENRWVALARLVPWELAEEIYHADLCKDIGQPIESSRVALGALLIKERLGLTDCETVETIQENPYLQFFIGFEEFTQDPPFDASLKNLGRRSTTVVGWINKLIVLSTRFFPRWLNAVIFGRVVKLMQSSQALQ